MAADSTPGSSEDSPTDDNAIHQPPTGELTLSAAALETFKGLQAPAPIAAAPPTPARWAAFAGVLVGGLLGGLIGYGTGDLLAGESGSAPVWAALGGLVGAIGCAVGVGIVVGLTLRAMGEWRAVHHPEADR